MKRRDFLKKSVSMGAAVGGMAAGSIFALGTPGTLFGAVGQAENRPGLVGVMGGKPGPMFDKGINALGGIRKFVKPNQTVVVKPNIGWDKEPDQAANTNPDLIKQIVAQCLDAGAKKVYVFDHTCDVWHKCYTHSGIKNAVMRAGGKIVPGNNERNYQRIKVPKGKSLTGGYAHELFLESDVFINVPVLKNHSGTKLTIGMKNLMGVVWDRGWWHSHNLHQCVADFATVRIPDLTVVDAYRVMKKNGPMGVSVDDTILMKAQILSTDPVAADAAAAKMFGMNPTDIPYIKMAHDMGVGTMDLTSLDIKRIRMK